MKLNKVIVLNGFRRVGKTYLLMHVAKELLKTNSRRQVVYLNFEDERIPLKTEFLTELIPTIEEMWGEAPKYLYLMKCNLFLIGVNGYEEYMINIIYVFLSQAAIRK
ncbi:MAG: AAA family ATPase [Bacteroidetes bacterium]|nr:AAA family ATPase [Bacteroidota bacterium]